MRSATDLFLRQGGEPAFDLIDPGSGSGREMDLETGMTGKPVFHRRGLVRAVVVHDQMDIEIARHVGIDGAQKLEELGAAMTPVQFADHLAAGDVEGSEQRGRAVAHVVMSASFGNAGGQRQDGLSTIQRLDLTLLIDTQNHRPNRRIQVQPHDVAHLLDKQWVGGELEGLLAVGLQTKGTPNPSDRRLRHAHFAGHVARAPVRGVLRHRLQCPGYHGIDLGIVNRPRRSRARRIEQTIQTLLGKPIAPLRDRLRRYSKPRRHLLVVPAVSAGKHHLRTHGQGLRRLAPTCPGFQLLTLRFVQHYLRFRSAAHRILQRLIVQPLRHAKSIFVQRTFNS
jgi:hypothetical protein